MSIDPKIQAVLDSFTTHAAAITKLIEAARTEIAQLAAANGLNAESTAALDDLMTRMAASAAAAAATTAALEADDPAPPPVE